MLQKQHKYSFSIFLHSIQKNSEGFAGFVSVECGSWNSILTPIKSTAALPGQTTKTAQTTEFMFQNVAYRPTVYITGGESSDFTMG